MLYDLIEAVNLKLNFKFLQENKLIFKHKKAEKIISALMIFN